MSNAFIFPGQGSQKIGMGRDLYDSFTEAREVFEEVGVKVKNIQYFDSQPWPFPASLMLGFFAEATSEEMNIDYNEIEDAHWFSIEELKTLLHPSITGGFKLPRIDSIARRLVDTWINKFN